MQVWWQFILQPKKLLQYGPVDYSSVHCVRAEALSLTLHLTSTPSEWICVSTPDDPLKSQMLMMTLGGVIPTVICLFVLAAVGGFAYYYICGHKPRLPKSVDVDMKRKLQTFQPDPPRINVIIFNITNLSTGESKHSFLSPFHHGVDVPESSPLTIVEDGEVSYAPQDAQNTSRASAGLHSHRGSLGEDYGLVCQEDRIQVASCPYKSQQCVGEVNPYTAQTGTTEPAQDRYEENEDGEMQRFCNWDEDPGQLQLDFPLLSRFGSETTETPTLGDMTLLPHHPALTSVMVKQGSEESEDDCLLLKMEKDWNLLIQSTTS
ncbi:uncharacterized protein LOC132868710 [Neoarius graeffei]|uniref:uncharacterized protein LOC132868710 n=1 Tax=Neoarius graeffei TaxID=443677 RepID=UPI00298C978F|nr:uncharacterized protein LOC132868710 [Neoarius graeffei]